MALPFQFLTQTIRIAYDLDAAIPSRVREAANGRRDEHLNPNHLASTEERLLVQSPTGTTIVEVRPDRADLTTQYFGEFSSPDASDRRVEYSRAKAGSLLGLLEAGGARLQFIGVINVARCSAASIGVERLRRAAVAAAALPGDLTDGDDVFDFTLRASRAVDEHTFSNVTLDWYQTRTAAFELAVGAAPARRLMRDWDFPIGDEGLEFRYDRNNKRGLFAGRRGWSAGDFVSVVEGCTRAAPPALARIATAIERELERLGDRRP